MSTYPKRHLEIGDPVGWTDPDNIECTGQYRIQEIVTESGRVVDEESVLVVTGNDGFCHEVWAVEVTLPD